MQIFKKLFRVLFGKYEIYRIFEVSDVQRLKKIDLNIISNNIHFGWVDSSLECEQSEFEEIRSITQYFGEQCKVSGAWVDGVLSSVLVFLYGEQYAQFRNFWPLKKNEIKIIQSHTIPSLMGQGISPALMQYSLVELDSQGFHHFFGRIWHNHRSAIRVIRKVGGEEIAMVIVIYPFGLSRSIRFEINKNCLLWRFIKWKDNDNKPKTS